ncbi:MAG TPA: hypothetical protein VG735_15050 [Caulobacterales bacterium]|nr:hypothetical protein [Caulobacterales bacterium]
MKLLSVTSALALSAVPLTAGCAHHMGAGMTHHGAMMQGASGQDSQTCPPPAAQAGQSGAAQSGAMMGGGQGGMMAGQGGMMGGQDGMMSTQNCTPAAAPADSQDHRAHHPDGQ